MTRHASRYSLHPDYADDAPEPSPHAWEAARIELGPDASNARVEARAHEIEDEDVRLWNERADEAEADSMLDDRNREF